MDLTQKSGTVDDLLSTLKGPVSEQLRAREGKRLSKGLDLRQEEGNNPTIPNKSDEGEPGTSSGRSLRPDDLTPYEKKQRDSAGKPIEGLDEEATEPSDNPEEERKE